MLQELGNNVNCKAYDRKKIAAKTASMTARQAIEMYQRVLSPRFQAGQQYKPMSRTLNMAPVRP